MVNVFYDVYLLMEKILNKIQDVNEDRVKSSDVNEKRWIFPTIPTGEDDSYPRISVQLSNVDEEAVSAGGYVSDNFKSNDVVKYKKTGKKYYVTVWIGLYIKREIKGKIDFPDGSVKYAKNTLLGNLLYDKLLKAIDASTSDIKEFAYHYNPFTKQISFGGYEDDSNRILYETSLRIPVLSTTDQVYNENELIQLINRNYTVQQ